MPDNTTPEVPRDPMAPRAPDAVRVDPLAPPPPEPIAPDATFMPPDIDPLRPPQGAPTRAEVSASQDVVSEQSLAEAFGNLPEDQQKAYRAMAESPDTLAKQIAAGGLSEVEAQNFLHVIYPEKTPEQIQAILADPKVKGAFLSQETERVAQETEQAPEFTSEQLDALPALQAKAQGVLQEADPEMRKEKLADLMRNFGATFGKETGKTVFRLLKIVGIGGGIFALIMVMLLAMHAPSGRN